MRVHDVVMKTFAASLALAGTSLAYGCSHETRHPTVPSTTAAQSPAALASASPGKGASTIYLSDAMRKACAIATIESVKEAPKFAFDESAVTAEDRDVLAAVAQCLTTGPLKGRTVKLVGRADPRGAQEYNMALGERRSNAVEKYLGGLGVAAAQMRDTSRGALDATGSDDASWQKDRRVDIDLVEAQP